MISEESVSAGVPDILSSISTTSFSSYSHTEQERTSDPNSFQKSSKHKKVPSHPMKWFRHGDFFFSFLGANVGLGNIWRFPYLCYQNGGGAFLICYIVCLFVVAIPILVLEFSLGQFSSSGPYNCFDLMPALKGLGISGVAMAMITSSYYNTVIAWAIHYVFLSFKAESTWHSCGNWSSALCETNLKSISDYVCNMEPSLVLYGNGTCYNKTTGTIYGISNRTLADLHNIKPHLPAEDYLSEVGFLRSRIDKNKPEMLRSDIVLCLFIAWMLSYFYLITEIHYFLAFVKITTFIPFMILVLVYIFGIMQDGSDLGIAFLLSHDTSQLFDPNVWVEALQQVVFSLGLFTGISTTLASKNRFHGNLVSHAIVVSFVDTFVSLYAGNVVFHFIGGVAKSRNVSFDSIFNKRFELIFVVIPQACATFTDSNLLPLTFFIMIILLACTSQVFYLSTSVACVAEISDTLKEYKFHISTCICMGLYLFSLSTATYGGSKIVETLNNHTSYWSLSITLLNLSIITVFYGPNRMSKDIEIMIGNASVRPFIFKWSQLQWWFRVCWCFLIPVIAVLLLVWKISYHIRQDEGSKTKIGMTMSVFEITLTMIPIITVLIINFKRYPGNFKEKLKSVFRPAPTWGPYLVRHRQEVYYVNNFMVNPYNLPTNLTSGH